MSPAGSTSGRCSWCIKNICADHGPIPRSPDQAFADDLVPQAAQSFKVKLAGVDMHRLTANRCGLRCAQPDRSQLPGIASGKRGGVQVAAHRRSKSTEDRQGGRHADLLTDDVQHEPGEQAGSGRGHPGPGVGVGYSYAGDRGRHRRVAPERASRLGQLVISGFRAQTHVSGDRALDLASGRWMLVISFVQPVIVRNRRVEPVRFDELAPPQRRT